MSEQICFLCGPLCESAKVTCPFCGVVSMCDEEEMEAHRPPGLNRCLPFKVSTKEGVGRILVASRDIKPGEMVILDRAVVILPDNDPVCLGCLFRLKPTFVKCESCKLPFCSEACTKSEVHEEECKILSKSTFPLEVEDITKPNYIYQCVSVLRTILAQNKSTFLSKQLRKLMTHNEIRRQQSDLHKALKKVCQLFVNHCGMNDEEINEEIAWKAYGIVETNSLGFGNMKARGIYPIVSLMSHNCVSNLFSISNPGEAVAFRAKRRIPKNSELTIRYINFLESRLYIRSQLKNHWFFDCICQRCSDPTEMGTYTSCVKCTQCSTGIVIPQNPLDSQSSWVCDKCGMPRSREEVISIEKEGKEIIAQITDNEAIVDAVKKLSTQFPSSNFLILMLKLKFVRTTFNDSELNRVKIGYAKSLLKTLEKLEGGHSPVIAQVAKELCKTEIILLTDDLKSTKITHEEYAKKIKPFILLQMDAKRWSQEP